MLGLSARATTADGVVLSKAKDAMNTTILLLSKGTFRRQLCLLNSCFLNSLTHLNSILRQISIQFLSIKIFHIKIHILGVERQFSSQEHWLLFQKTCIPFSEYIWHLTSSVQTCMQEKKKSCFFFLMYIPGCPFKSAVSISFVNILHSALIY